MIFNLIRKKSRLLVRCVFFSFIYFSFLPVWNAFWFVWGFFVSAYPCLWSRWPQSAPLCAPRWTGKTSTTSMHYNLVLFVVHNIWMEVNQKVFLQSVYCICKLLFQFMPVIKLAGHEDWVRGLDMTVDGKNILFFWFKVESYLVL